MKAEENLLKVLIAEPSDILRSGLSAVLNRIPGYRLQPIETNGTEGLEHLLTLHKPDLLVVNPAFWSVSDLEHARALPANPEMKIVALASAAYSDSLLARYDEVIGMHDSTEQIKQRLDRLYAPPESPADDAADSGEQLSDREKEILVLVVKGHTNKEIAQQLYLSTHTVITHRRNIARKLEIHSTSGLTVYALVNKLVELEDFK